MLLIQLMGTEKILKAEGASTSSYSNYVSVQILFWKGVLIIALHFQATIALWWFVLVTAPNYH